MKKILVKTLFVLAYSFEKVKGHYQVVVVVVFFTIECFAKYYNAFSTTITYIQVHSVSGSYWGSEPSDAFSNVFVFIIFKIVLVKLQVFCSLTALSSDLPLNNANM